MELAHFLHGLPNQNAKKGALRTNEPLLHGSWNEVRFYTTIAVYGSDRNPVAKRGGRDRRKEEDDEGTRRKRRGKESSSDETK